MNLNEVLLQCDLVKCFISNELAAKLIHKDTKYKKIRIYLCFSIEISMKNDCELYDDNHKRIFKQVVAALPVRDLILVEWAIVPRNRRVVGTPQI
jgi:hypothetical protein